MSTKTNLCKAIDDIKPCYIACHASPVKDIKMSPRKLVLQTYFYAKTFMTNSEVEIDILHYSIPI